MCQIFFLSNKKVTRTTIEIHWTELYQCPSSDSKSLAVTGITSPCSMGMSEFPWQAEGLPEGTPLALSSTAQKAMI